MLEAHAYLISFAGLYGFSVLSLRWNMKHSYASHINTVQCKQNRFSRVHTAYTPPGGRTQQDRHAYFVNETQGTLVEPLFLDKAMRV